MFCPFYLLSLSSFKILFFFHCHRSFLFVYCFSFCLSRFLFASPPLNNFSIFFVFHLNLFCTLYFWQKYFSSPRHWHFIFVKFHSGKLSMLIQYYFWKFIIHGKYKTERKKKLNLPLVKRSFRREKAKRARQRSNHLPETVSLFFSLLFM